MTETPGLPITESPDVAIETPNFYLLHGDGRTVSIATSGIDGKPHLSYQDSHRSVSFSGEEIIHTLGITAMHRTTIAGLGRGQLTTYHVSHLSGSASQVQF
jgi:hypothetical protein